MKKLFFTLMTIFILALNLTAQKIDSTHSPNNAALNKSNEVEMADALRENGKIYVVVAVLLIILAGIFIYLFILDKKISKIEKEIKVNNE